MKQETEVIQYSTVNIPEKEALAILQRAGYKLPNDAVMSFTYRDGNRVLAITWIRKQDENI